jgi:pimeloyl-ACP methyl ester carboxylesterase
VPENRTLKTAQILGGRVTLAGHGQGALSKELARAVKDRIAGPFDLRFITNCGHRVRQEPPEEYNEDLAPFPRIR